MPPRDYRRLARHPAVTLQWPLVDEPADLRAAGIDLWIRVGPIRDGTLSVQDLWTIERGIFASSGSEAALSPDDLADRTAVVLSGYVPKEILLTGPQGAVARIRPKARLTTDNIYASIVAAKAGIGYAFLPFWAVQSEIAAGHLVQLCPEWSPPKLSLSIAYRPERFRSARVSAFLEYLRMELPKLHARIWLSSLVE